MARGKGVTRVVARVTLVSGGPLDPVEHPPGAEVELPTAEAERLIAAGFAAAPAGAPAANEPPAAE